jgi:hypothetical protein
MCFSIRSRGRILLAAFTLAVMAPFAAAQGGGGGGSTGGAGGVGGGSSSSGGLNSTGSSSGGGGTSASGTGTTGTIGTSTPIGSGNISAFSNGSYGLSSLSSSGSKGSSSSSGSTQIPVASDPFSTFYVSPPSTGLIGNTSTANTFGQAQYTQPTLPTATTTTTTATVTTYKPTSIVGFTSIGQRTTPAYVTAVGPRMPMMSRDPVRLGTEVQQVLGRSSSLDVMSKNGIRLEVLPNSIVRLTGIVKDEADQRLAEGLVRMTPGVQNVENNLQVMPVQVSQSR